MERNVVVRVIAGQVRAVHRDSVHQEPQLHHSAFRRLFVKGALVDLAAELCVWVNPEPADPDELRAGRVDDLGGFGHVLFPPVRASQAEKNVIAELDPGLAHLLA